MPFCTQCGHENAVGDRFCSQCGAPQRQEARAGASAPAAAPAGSDPTATSTLSLPVLDGPRAGDAPAGGATAVEAPEPAAEEAGPTLSSADQAAVDALPPGSALLVVRRGPNAGSRFLLDSDATTAGRHPSSDIFLDDVTVSRRHAEFRRRGAGFLVVDVGSLNGTYVNRERIEEALLGNGDEVQIGKYRLVFFASAPVGAGS